MPNLWFIFLTGLTTGGLSCLAVQGGLLANVIGNQADEELSPKQKSDTPQHPISKKDLLNYYNSTQLDKKQIRSFQKDATLSILLFLIAKIVAYTLLGFGLGYLGTMIQLSPVGRGILMLAIAVFMLGTAMRLLNVHPIFNYFQLQPPKFIRSFIRRLSKNKQEDIATPLFLGALTVLIPCGVTQAMMALAIGTGNPLYGALIMLAFTIGSSPLFFILAYFATKLGEKLNAQFVKIVAVIIIIFAIYSIESGLNLLNAPFSFAAYKERLRTAQLENIPTAPITSTTQKPTPDPTPSASNSIKNEVQTAVIRVYDDGYEPRIFKLKAGIETELILETDEIYSCSRAFTIPSLGIQKILPETGSETIKIPAQKPGWLRFMCSMGMYTGNILFE